MSCAVYSVFRHGGSWKVQINRHNYGVFATRAAAIKIAIETAGIAGRYNHDGAVVMVVGDDQSRRLIWTYGKDVGPRSAFG